MNLDHYEYKISKTYLDYEFYSEGPKGRIKKVVRYTLIQQDGLSYYFLSFGDIRTDNGKIDDFTITDNKDAEKILATVASTVVEFTKRFPGILIYAEGSTPSRTRLYQMKINKYWREINKLFDVFGLLDNSGLTPFKKNQRYIAFTIRTKK